MSSPSPRRQPAAAPDGAPQSSGEAPEAPSSGGIERRRHPRITLESAGPEAITAGFRDAERRQGERRQGERRGTGNLRDNVGWTVASGSNNRSGDRLKLRFKRSRIVVLGIAMVAGGIAAYLASQMGRPQPTPAVAAEPVTTTRVLVASREIPVGHRLATASLSWQAWPNEALQPDFITAAKAPDATTEMAGLVARIGFLPGDPIRKEKLADSRGGFLSNTLGDGMRGVSVAVTAESASGGFISPNDRVDVVLTRTSTNGVGNPIPHSQTIVRNVLVLAINSEAGKPDAASASPEGPFTGHAIATLALGPSDADLVISASTVGKLSLLLRSGIDAAPKDGAATARDSANQAIRMTSPFWLK